GESTWAGPFSFHVFVLGDDCSAPITIDALPYTSTDDTANYSDNPNIEGSPGASGCGSTSSYLNGNDVVYSYTADSDGSVSVNLRSEEHTSELQSRENLVCRLLLEKKKKKTR